MGDEKQRATIVVEQGFQPLDGGKIQVVGRLVQQQKFGIGDQRTRQRHAFFQPPGQGLHRRIGIQVQPLQGFFHPAVQTPGIGHLQFVRQPLEVGIHRLVAFGHGMRHGMIIGQQLLRRADTFRHRLEDAVAGLKLRLLRHVGQLQARGTPHLPGIGLALARDDFQQARLAGAIAADQADALARLDHQRGAIEQRPVPIGQFESVKSKQGHVGSLVSVEGRDYPRLRAAWTAWAIFNALGVSL